MKVLKRTLDHKSMCLRIAVLLLMYCDINGRAKFKGKKLFYLLLDYFCFITL